MTYKSKCLRVTKKFIKKMLWNAEMAFQIGFEDAEKGNPCIKEADLPGGDDELETTAKSFCYALYVKGYNCGQKNGDGTNGHF